MVEKAKNVIQQKEDTMKQLEIEKEKLGKEAKIKDDKIKRKEKELELEK